MSVGASIFLIAVGLIFALAVNVDLSGTTRRLRDQPLVRETPVVREERVLREDPPRY